MTACNSSAIRGTTATNNALDRLLLAHAGLPPENDYGANHYPMAAEAMSAIGHEFAIPTEWRDGAGMYHGELRRASAIEDVASGLGDPARHGDWLDHFRNALGRTPWREVIRQWCPVLAPGLAGAMFHGLIRTAHAVRAIRQRECAARREELAAGLAYWATCYATLASTGTPRHTTDETLQAELASVKHPWLSDRTDVGFHSAMDRLLARPLAPDIRPEIERIAPQQELQTTIRAAAAGFLEMLVQERNRIWLLHTVTGPAAVGLILPDVDDPTASTLVEHARQTVIALYAAYGAPFVPQQHVRNATPPWAELVERTVASQSVHGIKLVEALHRCDDGRDRLFRSVAAQWLEWT